MVVTTQALPVKSVSVRQNDLSSINRFLSFSGKFGSGHPETGSWLSCPLLIVFFTIDVEQ